VVPDVSVVLVNYNAGLLIRPCLESLIAHSDGHIRELIVVDNASSDGSVETLEGMTPKLTIIRNRENLGLAAANNIGIAATTAPYVIVCNPDLEFNSDTLGALRGCFERHPRAGVVGARLLTPDGDLHTCAGELPRFREALFGKLRYGRYWWTDWAHDQEIPVGHVLEACYGIRRTAMEEVGVQDPAFFMNWEGIDWAARFISGGWEIWFCPQAQAVHLGGVSVRQVKWRWERWSHLSMYRYFRKHSRIPAAVLAPTIAVRLAVKVAWAMARGFETLPPPVRTQSSG
jgi:GT2 family glycosyltransferase